MFVPTKYQGVGVVKSYFKRNGPLSQSISTPCRDTTKTQRLFFFCFLFIFYFFLWPAKRTSCKSPLGREVLVVVVKSRGPLSGRFFPYPEGAIKRYGTDTRSFFLYAFITCCCTTVGLTYITGGSRGNYTKIRCVSFHLFVLNTRF